MINAAGICGKFMTENPTGPTGQFDFGLATERAAQYLPEHGDDVADVLLHDWCEAVRPIESPDAFFYVCDEPSPRSA
jgi:hypothetical protein